MLHQTLLWSIYRAFKEYKEEREEFNVTTSPVIKELPEEKPQIGIEEQKTRSQPVIIPSKKEEEITVSKEIYYTVQIVTSGLKKDLNPENLYLRQA